MTDLLRPTQQLLEAHPVPEWVEQVCADFGVMESGAPRYRVIWNPDRVRQMNIINPETGQFVQRVIHKYPMLGPRWIVEALLPWEIYGRWHEEAFGPKPPDGEYCHTHTIQLDLPGMLKAPSYERTQYLSLDDFGQDNLRLLLACIERGKAVQAWQVKNYDQELLARADREFHDQFENVYDDNLGELKALEKLSEDTGIRTSLDPLPKPIEAERRARARKQGKNLIH